MSSLTLTAASWISFLAGSTAAERAAAWAAFGVDTIEFLDASDSVIRTVTCGAWSVGSPQGGYYPVIPGVYTDAATGSGTAVTAVFRDGATERFRCTVGMKNAVTQAITRPGFYLLAGEIVAGVPIRRGSFSILIPPVSSVAPSVPVNVSLPTIAPTVAYAGSILACSVGTWTNTPTSYAYQWYRDGSAISGATASQYTVPSDAGGAAIRCDVTPSNAGGTGATASSPVRDVFGLRAVPSPIPITQGGTYNLAQHLVGGTAPFGGWAIDSGSWPQISIDAATGVISAGASAPPGASGTIVWGVNDQAVASTPMSATFKLNASAGSGLPFSLGQVFKNGDVPAGSYVTVTGAGLETYQVKVLSTWRDGSARFSVISGTYTSAGAERTFSLGTTALSPTGSSLSLTDLKATGVTASIAFGAYGTASWSGSDWDTPFLQHVSGPIMSSWVFRKAMPSDSHATAWVEVRLYAGGAVQVLPWIENGYLKVASPGTRSGTATFTLGGTQRFSSALTIPHHCRTVLCSGSTFWHWLGSDPGVTWKHDTAYLMATKMTPTYFAGPSETVLNSFAQTYTPLGQHDYPASMGAAGYDGSIGLLPEWDAEYLVSGGDVRAWKASIVNGYASGRYGIHYRDETTQRVPMCASYPNLVLNSTNSGTYSIGNSETSDYTPTPGGSAPATYTNSHVPAFGFMPYLLTGLWYFLDEMQHAAFFPYLKNADATRDYGSYMLETAAGANQIRGAAWALRTIAQAAAMTSDADTAQKIQWRSVVEHNASVMHARYVAQPNNPLGLCQNDVERYWMDDFYTMVWGYTKDLVVQLSGNDAKVSEFCAYKYKSPVGRLGLNSSGNWSYRKAVQYDGAYSPAGNDGADWGGGTGPWYANWGAAYVAYGLTYDAGDTLLGSYADEYAFAQSYWGNLMPAIAYAVDHGATGASEAYARLTGASNWLANKAFFTDYGPQWAIKPRSVA